MERTLWESLCVTRSIFSFVLGILSFSIFLLPIQAIALETSSVGEQLFVQHCSGCHVNGGNIIRRNKTLKLAALKRQGIDNPEAIAKIAREGIGTMSGYIEVLGEGGDLLVSNWVWTQAQNAWTHG